MSERRGSISFRDVSKEYPATEVSPALLAVDHVSFEAEAGSFVSIIGESGCGKTSLLRIQAGLEQPSGGSVEIDACPVTGPDPKCGMVFQNNILFPWLTVRENVAFGPKRMGRYKGCEGEVDELLAAVRIEDFAAAYPSQLSGGMQQRVALARALATKPDVLLLDEPLSALDALTRMRLQDELLRLWQQRGNTAVMITHDIDEALYLSQQIVVMTPRPGRVNTILDIDLPYPRSRASEVFVALRNRLLELLHFAENREKDEVRDV